MKKARSIFSVSLLMLLPVLASAQVTPTTPTSFSIRPVGNTAEVGATVSKTSVPAVKQTTYITLCPARQWISADGKSKIGQLIAWEQSVAVVAVTSTAAKPETTPPPLTGKPTVLRDGKVRLLIDHKPYEVPVDRLNEDARTYISQLQAAIAAKP